MASLRRGVWGMLCGPGAWLASRLCRWHHDGDDDDDDDE